MTEALPEPKKVLDTLKGLLGREVTVNVTDPAGDAPVAAVYQHNDQSLAGVIGFDLPLAANTAAAMGLVPPGGAEACVEDGELSPLLTDILGEVSNILTGMFNVPGRPHVKFHALHTSAAEVPADVRSHLAALGNRLDLTVGIAGYKGGVMSIVVPLN
ncbi:hypothetical protein [Actinokineospora terrae]|uniref:Chemotaxis phosphatase CheX-like domain-containing protein n=1 Tax=Actinokineospora terrae TaxID=155974 RepID=A0A1H9X0H6_9PSEU|nr:hypothetical protein [Actinokineospora terrae]SES39615.1 hypothetical protein SAMN04487818_11291 [Actinokineospora terrae]